MLSAAASIGRAARGDALAGLLVGILCSAMVGVAPAAPPGDGLRLLFIGNSLTYSNDLPSMVGEILRAAGTPAEHIEVIAPPNYGLQDHWALPATRRAIGEGGFDVVVMQQGPSATEGRPSLLEYSARFATEIRAAGARPALYQVWPARSRSFDFDAVTDAYRSAAARIDGLLLPAGEAWQVVWAVDPDLPLYGPDGFHPSPTGTYLAALVIAARLGAVSVASMPPPSGAGKVPLLAPDVDALLRAAATEANERYAGGPFRWLRSSADGLLGAPRQGELPLHVLGPPEAIVKIRQDVVRQRQ